VRLVRRTRVNAAQARQAATYHPRCEREGSPRLGEPGELVEHEGAGDGRVQAGAGAHHGNLDDVVEQVERLRRDTCLLVAQHHDGAAADSGDVREAGGVFGQFDADDGCAACPLLRQPAQRCADAVYARGPAQLPPISSPYGAAQFLTVFGITAGELARMQATSTSAVLGELAAGNPALITLPGRGFGQE
jgi:hypothetical protein